MNSRKYLSDAERSHLETICYSALETATRDATLILMALYSGARAGELLALEWDDINLSTGSVYIQTAKRGRDREVPVPKPVREALILLYSKSLERPFPISYTRLVEVWHFYRPVKKPFHSLRHSFAMRVYEQTKDLRFVKYAMGHRSINSTMVYADRAYEVAESKKLMRLR